MWQEQQPSAIGEMVRVRGDRWCVAGVTRYAGCVRYDLWGAGRWNRGRKRALLCPFDRVLPAERPGRPRRVSRAGWLLALRALLATRPGLGSLQSAVSANIRVLPYQLEPALAALAGTPRILLADEVGLGKTIQGGLLIAELFSRCEASRVLILAPAGLCSQWQAEMRLRFGLDAHVADSAGLRAVTAGTLTGSPWDRLDLAVASLDFVKQPEVLQGMLASCWDLLVIDEAHLAAVARERSAAVIRLAERSSRVLLLTATPHSGDEAAFAALCEIGRLSGEGPILMFRRTRLSLGLPVSRRSMVLVVRQSAVERRLHQALRRYTDRVWQQSASRDSGSHARLAMIVLRKRASSGPASLLASLLRRQALLAGDAPGEEQQLLLPLVAEDEDAADDQPGGVLAAVGLQDAAAERRMLAHLISLARLALPVDSKLAGLRRLLRRVREPAVVFSEYRDTVERLRQALSAGTRTVILHGGLDPGERREAVSDFVRGRADLLLATDAAAHGLNLQATCRLVVNFDLPWNPVRLEQRIGRVDRIGQERRVHAVHLLGRGTGEERVLGRLTKRAGLASAALGESAGRHAEWETAERVFAKTGAKCEAKSDAKEECTLDGPRRRIDGERCQSGLQVDAQGQVTAAPPSPTPEARGEAERLEAARRLLDVRPLGTKPQVEQLLSDIDSTAPWILTRRHFPSGPRGVIAHGATGEGPVVPPGLLCLFRVTIVNARGSPVEQLLVPVVVALSPVSLVRTIPTVDLVRAAEAALREPAREAARQRLEQLRLVAADRLRPLLRRETQMTKRLAASHPSPIQPSLFDRRALVQRESEEAGKQRQQEAHLAKAGALERMASLELGGEPVLLLATVHGL